MSTGRWFRPRTIWLPTWRVWLVLGLIVVLGESWVATRLHGWLAVSAPIEGAPYVVVEGWVPDVVARQALDWSNCHGVKLIFTTGIPLEKGQFLFNYPSHAEICAETLIGMGADPLKVRPAPAAKVGVERTRAMALVLKKALDAEQIPAAERQINLFTSGTHAFRSRMHFQRVLGKDWQVGVVSVPSEGYPADAWWRYSEGVKSVIDEVIGIAVQGLSGG